MAMIEKDMHLEIYDPQAATSEKTLVWPLCWLENDPRSGETLLKDSSSKLIGGASTNCQTGPSCVDHLKRTSAGSTGLQKMMAVLRPPKTGFREVLFIHFFGLHVGLEHGILG